MLEFDADEEEDVSEEAETRTVETKRRVDDPLVARLEVRFVDMVDPLFMVAFR